MFKPISHLPIAGRLALAFTLMAVLASLIIAVLGLSFTTALSSHSQAIPIAPGMVLFETFIALVCMMIAVAAIGYFTTRSITQPLQELSNLTRRIAEGDTKARANPTGHDEIYLIATSMNSMLDNIVHLIQETQSQHDTLQTQVEKLVSEVSGVGEGDLRVQAEVTADALGVLADSFNYMVEELASLVVRVKAVASEVERSTAANLDRMAQLVENGDQQINQIANAVIEVEHMAAASRHVAECSQVLSKVAHVARHDAQIGRTSLMQVVEGIGHIDNYVQTTASKVQMLGEHSRQINDVVEAIQSITHQTNRLALDAAIQAAMAGSNGKGFGAVAADIRRQAERSKEQADMIAQIVRSIREEIAAVALSMQETQRETANGTKLTQEAGIALESIFAAVEHQAREIENINQMGIQQLQSSSTIVQIMHTVSESTQQAGLSTREAAQNMERLARLVEQLRASVEAFKLREDQRHKIHARQSAMDDLMHSQVTTGNSLRTVTATARTIQPSGAGNSLSVIGNTSNTFFPPQTDSFTPI